MKSTTTNTPSTKTPKLKTPKRIYAIVDEAGEIDLSFNKLSDANSFLGTTGVDTDRVVTYELVERKVAAKPAKKSATKVAAKAKAINKTSNGFTLAS